MTGASDTESSADLAVPALTIIAHPEPHRVGEVVTLPELMSDQTVELSRLSPRFAPIWSLDRSERRPTSNPLTEVHLSRRPILLRPGARRGDVIVDPTGSPIQLLVDGESLSGPKPLDRADLHRGVVLELAQRVVLVLDEQLAAPPELPSFGLVGASAAMLRLRRAMQMAADSSASVLIQGESGAGKELVARGVHDAGARRGGPYVTVNMAAIPPSLAASELFGAKKGAFTGADTQKSGFFQRANGGTLFLDEIGETPAEIQPLLLRALENGEIQSVGSAETRTVDVRVIAATDSDLAALADDGSFRRPLFHRLAGFEIHVPPLRRRRSDIGRLIAAFLARDASEEDTDTASTWPSAPLIAELTRFDWPGNVRQLLAMTRRWRMGRRMGAAPTASELLGTSPEPESPSDQDGDDAKGRWVPVYRHKDEVTPEELLAALRAHRFELKPTAEALGVSRTALYELVDMHPDIRKASDVPRREIEDALSRLGSDLSAISAELEISLQGLKRRMTQLGITG